MQFCHTTQCHRWLKFWGSVQLACCLQECPPELLPDNLMLNFFTINCLQRRFKDWQPQTKCNHTCPGPPHPASSPAGSSKEGEGWLWGVFRSVKKPFVGKNTWLAGPGSPVGGPTVCHSRPTYGCAPAQSCEIYRLGSKEFISIDFLLWSVTQLNLWNGCMLRLYFCSVYWLIFFFFPETVFYLDIHQTQPLLIEIVIYA